MSILLRLALCLGLMLSGTQVLAHALPGTSLTIRADTHGIHLNITMPLRELDLAMPEASGMGPDPASGPVQGPAKERIAGYLAAHLGLANASGQDLALRLSDVRIERAQEDHVGDYTVLVIDLTAPTAALPFTLRYDAIMHEVRSHRATVSLQAPGSGPVAIGVIRIDPATGKAADLTIPTLP